MLSDPRLAKEQASSGRQIEVEELWRRYWHMGRHTSQFLLTMCAMGTEIAHILSRWMALVTFRITAISIHKFCPASSIYGQTKAHVEVGGYKPPCVGCGCCGCSSPPSDFLVFVASTGYIPFKGDFIQLSPSAAFDNQQSYLNVMWVSKSLEGWQ